MADLQGQMIFKGGDVVGVVVPTAARGPYDYRVPPGLTVGAGDLIRVPFGRREVTGVVWGQGAGDVPPEKMKDILGLVAVDGPSLPASMIPFIDTMAAYNCADLSATLKLALPIDIGAKQPKTRAGGKPPGGASPDPDHMGVSLTSDQQDAAYMLTAAVEAAAFETIVLDGVTGSGKTEVYFEAVARAIRMGRQVLVMVPEIGLTSAFVERFQKRFGSPPAVWHSGLTPAQRRKTFMGILDGTIKVVAGARSALMLPYPNLGLIVVDEEHDASYKQEDGVMYNARDMAVLRAHKAGFPVILASATPSLETTANVGAGRYKIVKLASRFGVAQMPSIRVVDLRNDKPEKGQFISPTLYAAMRETLGRGEQVLLFLNRRGYAPLTLCRACGHRFNCPRCTAWMVSHRRTGHLHCHHCGYETRAPKHCPSCNEEGSMVACGPGVERIEEEVRVAFPDARTLILSSDLMDNPKDVADALARIEARQVDIVIGTQMIAKGHHFPHLTLVGVIDADLGLSGGDLRAAERTFQLLQQVAGRAGREDKPGSVILQTFMPDHKVMQALAAGDRDAFLDVEAAERQAAHMPPYARLAGVIVSGKDEAQTRGLASELSRAAPHHVPGLKVWGPAEAQMYRLRGKYRLRFLVQAERNVNVQRAVQEWLGQVKIPSSMDARIDIDPQSFF